MVEAEDNVGSSVLVVVGKKLLDADPEHDGQPGIVGLEKDADAMDLLDVGDVAEDAVKVLLVLFNSPGIPNAWSVNEFDDLAILRKDMGGRLLCCRLSIFKVLVVSRIPDEDGPTLANVCSEGELGWARCEHLKILLRSDF